MKTIEGFVLAGGQSRRMGQEKAQLRLGGLTLVERAVGVLERVADPVYIVGRLEGGAERDRCIDDEFLGEHRSGSVIGLYTALVNAKSEWAAILACDLPFVPTELFIKMISLVQQFEGTPDKPIDTILPKQPDGQIQPLCGLYRPSTCLPQVRMILSGDNWRLQDLAKSINSHFLEFSEYADIDGAQNLFLNVNTPEDFQAAVALGSSYQ